MQPATHCHLTICVVRRKKKQTLKITIVETDDDDDAVVAVLVDVIFVDMKGSQIAITQYVEYNRLDYLVA